MWCFCLFFVFQMFFFFNKYYMFSILLTNSVVLGVCLHGTRGGLDELDIQYANQLIKRLVVKADVFRSPKRFAVSLTLSMPFFLEMHGMHKAAAMRFSEYPAPRQT